jgi:hypothetical protein
MTVTPYAMPGAKPPKPPPPPTPSLTPITLHPDPLPGPPAPTRHLPLYGVQYLRREALRLAIQRHHDTGATNQEILGTALLFAEYIRNGTT